MNYSRCHINNERFSVRFCYIAKHYGHKTVGSFEKALNRAYPNSMWGNSITKVRGARLLAEINSFKELYNNN